MRQRPLIRVLRDHLRNATATLAPGWRAPSRRFVLSVLARLPLLGVGGAALASGPALAARHPPRTGTHVTRTIAAVIDHMLPGDDDLPGARALGLDARLAAIADPALLDSFADGVAWLDAAARRAGAKNFRALDEAGREAALQAALTSRAEAAQAFVRELRELALRGYYTHPAVMAAFPYAGPPQPAGFSDFQEPPQ